MFNRVMWACVDTRATFDAFSDILAYRFPVFNLKDFHGTSGDTFSRSLTFLIINGDGDTAFFKFFFHKEHSLLITRDGNPSYYFRVSRLIRSFSLGNQIFIKSMRLPVS